MLLEKICQRVRFQNSFGPKFKLLLIGSFQPVQGLGIKWTETTLELTGKNGALTLSHTSGHTLFHALLHTLLHTLSHTFFHTLGSKPFCQACHGLLLLRVLRFVLRPFIIVQG